MRLTLGERLWNGAVVSEALASAYNALCDRIEAFERDGKPAPQNLLNARHNLIAGVPR